MRHVEGIASTRYSGQRTIETEQINGQFRLKDNTRGNGITTYNNFNQTSHTNTHYLDNDNNWSVAEYNNANRDNSALDAHWGSMMTYDYFSQTHNRNSIDNNGYELINYVNADLTGGNWNLPNSDNAFWNGSVMTYGMGTNLDPIVSIDVIAHEIGHGLNDYTANLTYERESGALDEGLSDIWGAMVEFYAAPEKDTYSLGEDLGQVFRSMSNPKLRNDPDTYGGTFWQEPNCGTPTPNNDRCGVHTNSGILNHWFYLLAEGSSATDEINDNGDTFSIAGIGKLAAARIIFRAETVYFTPTTDYHDARDLTIQAAEDLYGVNSVEAITTNNAWYAVGIGNEISGLLIGDDLICYSQNKAYTLTNLINQTSTWQVSSNLQIVSSTSNSITVKAKYSSGSTGWIRANFNSRNPIIKNVQINNPPLTNNDYFVRDSYYNTLNGSGTSFDPYLISNGEEYIIAISSNNVIEINYTTIPSGWTSYSYGIYEIAFTPNYMNYGNTYAIDIDYTGICNNSVHTI